VTKEVTAYVGAPIGGALVDYLDTPGVGDMDVSPMTVLNMLEQELSGIDAADDVDGIVVTSPISEGRLKLGAQLVKILVQQGFAGEDKWSNVILVGTKADRATKEELESFMSQALDEDGNHVGIAAQFFSDAGGKGTVVTTSIKDYSQLRAAIAALPPRKVRYSAPQPDAMLAAFGMILGMDPTPFRRELQKARSELQTELERRRADQEAAARVRQELERKQAELEQAAERASHQDGKIDELKQQVSMLSESRARNYNFGSSSAAVGYCSHPSTRNWGNKSGRGCKCLVCKAELGRR